MKIELLVMLSTPLAVQLMSYSLYLLKVFCPFAEKQGGTVFQVEEAVFLPLLFNLPLSLDPVMAQ